MRFATTEWAVIANALRVCASMNEEESRGGIMEDHWRAQAAKERALAERIEEEMGV